MRVAGRRCSSWLASTPASSAIINRNPINLSGVDSDGSRSVFNPNPAYLNSMILNHIRVLNTFGEVLGATQTVSKEKPLRQFVTGKGKSAGRNSKGRITIFHRGVRWEGEGKTKDVDPAEKYYVEDIFPPFVVTSYRTGMKGQFSFSSIPGMIESRKAVSNRPKTRHVVMGLSNGADGLHCCFYTELGVPRMALAGSRPDFFVPRYKDAVRDSQSMAPNESVRQQDIGLNFVGVVGEKYPRMKAREKAREKQLLNGKFTADRATVTYILATNQVKSKSIKSRMPNDFEMDCHATVISKKPTLDIGNGIVNAITNNLHERCCPYVGNSNSQLRLNTDCTPEKLSSVDKDILSKQRTFDSNQIQGLGIVSSESANRMAIATTNGVHISTPLCDGANVHNKCPTQSPLTSSTIRPNVYSKEKCKSRYRQPANHRHMQQSKPAGEPQYNKQEEIAAMSNYKAQLLHKMCISNVNSNCRQQKADNAKIISKASSTSQAPYECTHLGKCECVCRHCGAMFWECERHTKSVSRREPEYSKCCHGGRVSLCAVPEYPQYIKELYKNRHFIENIRAYNQMFSMTSLGVNVDTSINDGKGPYVFRVSGQIYHWIGSMCPDNDATPRFLQLYIYDTENEVKNRMAHFGGECEGGLKKEIVEGLIEFLDNNNALVQLFRTARDKYMESDIPNLKVKLYNVIGTRRYELPTPETIGAIVFGSSSSTMENEFDLIIEEHSRFPQRVNKLHPCYMSLQFPLLFIYGEQGYHKGLKLLNTPNATTKANKQMSMNMYYSYQIHERLNQYTLLPRGGRLFQQYVVTAYCAIEQDRLDYIRQNQSDIRNEYLSGLYDAIMRGDRDGSDLGTRLVLTASFIGGPRYMYSHYLDALAICRVHGNPSFFITFTCNAKWPEIEEYMEAFPELTAADRADIVDRVFEKKIRDYIKFVRNTQTFGDITAAELPDPTEDAEGYRVISELMIHGPCGYANTSAPCMKDGTSCDRNFSKPYSDKTSIDKDGYIHYRRRTTGIDTERQNVRLDNSMLEDSRFSHTLSRPSCANIGYPLGKHAADNVPKSFGEGQEWIEALQEAAISATASELRKLFIQILMFCDVGNPLSLWDMFWKLIAEANIRKYAAISKNIQKLIFVYGHGFLWKAITYALRSDERIVLVVASSGIASLLLLSGRTAHSRFKIPLNLNDGSICNIKKNSQLADLLKQSDSIIWDEAPMSDRRCFEALDNCLKIWKVKASGNTSCGW
ncbi:DNA helicase [Tanacetum coccineum]